MSTRHSIGRDDLHGGGAPIIITHQSPPRALARAAPVTHHFSALVFCIAGQLRIEQREAWTMEAGDVLIVPAGQSHRWLASPSPSSSWTVGFCASCLAADDTASLLEPFERVRAGASPVLRVASERLAFLEILFGELASATAAKRRAETSIIQRSLLNLVLGEVQRAARWASAGSAPAGVVVDALRFIERNCLKRLSLSDVAKAVGRSPAYVTTALSRETGRSAVEWIVAGRMAEARRILLHSDEMIDVIAERVGYADPTHFIRMFRREHGVTPAAWRTANRRKGPPR